LLQHSHLLRHALKFITATSRYANAMRRRLDLTRYQDRWCLPAKTCAGCDEGYALKLEHHDTVQQTKTDTAFCRTATTA
jgi:hypothetical protein